VTIDGSIVDAQVGSTNYTIWTRTLFERENLIASRAHSSFRERLRREVKRLVTVAFGL
jgi:hypothetical protein